MADYKIGGERQKQLAANIVGYLKLADESEQFRVPFGLNIEQACGTCGDRMAYYLLFLDLEARLLTMDLSDTQALGDFLLKGYWQMNLLEKCAQATVATLPFFDEIEVYLGYPVMLKERLQIPIDIEEMLYFSCSALTPEHLEVAADYVEKRYGNEEARLNFLIDQPTWLKALELAYPEDIETLKETRSTSEDYAQANEDYKAGLQELSKRALASVK